MRVVLVYHPWSYDVRRHVFLCREENVWDCVRTSKRNGVGIGIGEVRRIGCILVDNFEPHPIVEYMAGGSRLEVDSFGSKQDAKHIQTTHWILSYIPLGLTPTLPRCMSRGRGLTTLGRSRPVPRKVRLVLPAHHSSELQYTARFWRFIESKGLHHAIEDDATAFTH